MDLLQFRMCKTALKTLEGSMYENKYLRMAVAIFVGAVLGGFVAHALGVFSFVGVFVGGFAGWLSYDLSEVRRTVFHGASEAGVLISHLWEQSLVQWRARHTSSLVEDHDLRSILDIVMDGVFTFEDKIFLPGLMIIAVAIGVVLGLVALLLLWVLPGCVSLTVFLPALGVVYIHSLFPLTGVAGLVAGFFVGVCGICSFVRALMYLAMSNKIIDGYLKDADNSLPSEGMAEDYCALLRKSLFTHFYFARDGWVRGTALPAIWFWVVRVWRALKIALEAVVNFVILLHSGERLTCGVYAALGVCVGVYGLPTSIPEFLQIVIGAFAGVVVGLPMYYLFHRLIPTKVKFVRSRT